MIRGAQLGAASLVVALAMLGMVEAGRADNPWCKMDPFVSWPDMEGDPARFILIAARSRQ